MPVPTVSPLTSLLAREVMHAPVTAVDPSASLVDVATVLADRRIHCVVVEGVHTKDGAERLVWGVVSDRDLVRGALDLSADPTAGDLAATEALCVDADDDLGTVCRLLVEHECSHVVVVERGRPAGVISTLDIASALGR